MAVVCVLAALSVLGLGGRAAYAWDAGNDNGVKDCTHDACSGGVVTSSWIATDAAWGKSQLPGNRCPTGTEHYGGFCYKACPRGTHRTAVCSCKKDNTHALDITAVETNCAKFGSTNRIPDKVCDASHQYWGGLCYVKCPTSAGISAERTAPLTCKFTAKWRGNTHLWVVREALVLLAADKADEPSQFAWKRMTRTGTNGCKAQWELGLYEMDDAPHVETSKLGSHFYNGARKDYEDKPTSVVTYLLPSQNTTAHGNARTNADANHRNAMKKDGGLDMDCRLFGRSLHFQTDMTMPFHASGFSAAQIPPMLHAYIEFYAAVIQENYNAARSGARWDRRWHTLNADQVLHETSVKSQRYAKGLIGAAKPLKLPTCTYLVRGATTFTDHCWRGDPAIDTQLATILRDSYQATASYVRAAWMPVFDACKRKHGANYRNLCL